jgi:hypothetical protein
MDISRQGARAATFKTCIDAAHDYGLTKAQGREIIDRQVSMVENSWADVCELTA